MTVLLWAQRATPQGGLAGHSGCKCRGTRSLGQQMVPSLALRAKHSNR